MMIAESATKAAAIGRYILAYAEEANAQAELVETHIV
jgi:hypothetical protein